MQINKKLNKGETCKISSCGHLTLTPSSELSTPSRTNKAERFELSSSPTLCSAIKLCFAPAADINSRLNTIQKVM